MARKLADEAVLGLSAEQSRHAVEVLMEMIHAAILEGAPVSLPNIGTIETYQGKRTRTTDIQTGKVVNVPARRRVRFKATRSLSEEVRES